MVRLDELPLIAFVVPTQLGEWLNVFDVLGLLSVPFWPPAVPRVKVFEHLDVSTVFAKKMFVPEMAFAVGFVTKHTPL